MENEKRRLVSDEPIENGSDDKLGYALPAAKVADMIFNLLPSSKKSSFVIGIYGQWGSGKTSFVNLMKRRFDQITEQEGKKNAITCMDYNPRWVSEKEEIIRSFFEAVLHRISLFDIKEELKGLFAEVAGIINKFFFKNAFAETIEHYKQKPDIEILHEKITKLLENKGCLVVFIDDLDRLFPEEIIQVFWLIKSVLNIPSITYVVALDPHVVTRHLSEKKLDGDRYLEKIVQFPIQLPSLSKMGYHDFLRESLELFGDHVVSQPQMQEVVRHLHNVLTTARAIKQLQNAVLFKFRYGVELELWQFLLLESFRITNPRIMRYLLNNRKDLEGDTDPNISTSNSLALLFTKCYEMLENNVLSANMFIVMFPRSQNQYIKYIGVSHAPGLTYELAVNYKQLGLYADMIAMQK